MNYENMASWKSIIALAWMLVVVVEGQMNWQNEVNVSMCSWAQPRVNIIRDTIYVDGGDLWWLQGFSDGTYGNPTDFGGVKNNVYTFNLGQSFNQSTNLTSLFGIIPRTGLLDGNNIAPNYLDGAMFANDYEYITYGGLLLPITGLSSPPEDAILGYEAYQYGPYREAWAPGFVAKKLPQNITRYVTNGASASAPSENMGYYFSGMRGPNWDPIFELGDNATTTANTLITVNMTVMRQETWTNETLPPFVPGRANAELAWIPAGENGVLVAIGGVIDPASLTVNQSLNASQSKASSQIGPTFIQTVSVYDVASRKWYQQNTTGDIPPQLTMFCSVVAPASDRSSFNVYIYGGYDGISQNSIPSDDVYVLSIPQMVWTHAYTGASNHGRSGHKCIMAYPDQMMIIGGLCRNNQAICLQGGIIEVFNLNNLKFQDSYNPRIWSQYNIPSVVTANIGGNFNPFPYSQNGGATFQLPSPISDLFATTYTKTIPSYYPYTPYPVNPTNSSAPSPNPTSIVIANSGGLPSWVAPVLGVVIGLIVVVTALILFLVWRRKRASRSTGASETQASINGIKGTVLGWLHSTRTHDMKDNPGPGPAFPDASAMVSPKLRERHVSEAGSMSLHEMESVSTPVFEMSQDAQSLRGNEGQWSYSPRSPQLVSPNIDEMMGSGPSPVRPRPPNFRHTSSNLSTGHLSDDSTLSEMGPSEPSRPPQSSHASGNSTSDQASAAVLETSSQLEGTSREWTSTATEGMSRRISTVLEDDQIDRGTAASNQLPSRNPRFSEFE